jgi:isopentenyldiphosphate isomerase
MVRTVFMERIYQLLYTICNQKNVMTGPPKKINSPLEDEMLEVVTRGGETTDVLPRSEIHGNPALIHKVVHLIVTDKAGRLLLQKRSMDRDVAPGRWDTSVGGHVNAGETVEEALLREMSEELGITTCRPEFLYRYIHSNAYETELVYTYRCVYDGEIRFNRDEIDEVRFWSVEEINMNIGKEIFSDNFEHEFGMFRKTR